MKVPFNVPFTLGAEAGGGPEHVFKRVGTSAVTINSVYGSTGTVMHAVAAPGSNYTTHDSNEAFDLEQLPAFVTKIS